MALFFCLFFFLTAQQLRFGYFASYNVPFFPEVYKLSGFEEYAAKHIEFSWQMAPRARLFRRDANAVNTMDDLKAIMRYNDYLTDPYEKVWVASRKVDLILLFRAILIGPSVLVVI
jgi:hypothetical protein